MLQAVCWGYKGRFGNCYIREPSDTTDGLVLLPIGANYDLTRVYSIDDFQEPQMFPINPTTVQAAVAFGGQM